jgi:hypothetical protein
MTTTLIDECNIAAYRSWPDRRVTPTCAPSASCLGSLVSPDVALYATTGASGVKGDGSGADREAGGDGLAVDARLPPRHSQSGMAVGAAPPTTPAERRRHLTVHPGARYRLRDGIAAAAAPVGMLDAPLAGRSVHHSHVLHRADGIESRRPEATRRVGIPLGINSSIPAGPAVSTWTVNRT